MTSHVLNINISHHGAHDGAIRFHLQLDAV